MKTSYNLLSVSFLLASVLIGIALIYHAAVFATNVTLLMFTFLAMNERLLHCFYQGFIWIWVWNCYLDPYWPY